MQKFRTYLPVIMIAGLFVFSIACGPDPAGDENNNNGGTSCGDGTCNGDENCTSCPADCTVGCTVCDNDGTCEADEPCTATCRDCCTSCTLDQMSGTVSNYLVHTLFIPDSATAALGNGVDLNDDGTVDNKLGSIISLLATQGMEDDINVLINEEIAEAGLILIARIVENDPADGDVAVQVLLGQAVAGATPLAFDGDDTVAVDPTFDDSIYLCGEWEAPAMMAGPDDLPFSIPLPDIGTVNVTLESAIVQTDTDLFSDASVTTGGMTNVVIGGGLSKDQIDNELIPFVLTFLNDMIAEDPSGSTASTLLGLFDDSCDVSVCPDADTDPDCDADDELTEKELQCNMLLNTALSPDVDIDGDGTNDLLSLGLTLVDAVPTNVQ